MTHLLYVWHQQRPDRQKGKRRDIREIRDSEPKYPNLAHCSDEIKSVNFKIRKLPSQQQINQNTQAKKYNTAKKFFSQTEKGLLPLSYGNFLPFNRERHLGNTKYCQHIFCWPGEHER